MGFGEMIVAVVALKTISDLVKTLMCRQERKADERMAAEVEALRREVRELRRQHQDTILSFDSTLDRLDRRMDRLDSRNERCEELPGGERVSDREPVANGRSHYR